MSQGGVSIPVTFNWSQAAAQLAALGQAGRQTASGIAQAFQAIPTTAAGLQQVTQQMQAAATAAQALKDKGDIRIALRGEGIAQIRQEFDDVSKTAQALAGKKYSVQINVDSNSLRTDLASVRAQLQGSEKGQNFNLNLRVNADEGRQTLDALEKDLKAAEARGVKIAVTVDTAGAARDADQAIKDAQRKADQAAAAIKQANAKAAAEAQAAINQVRINVTLSGAQTTSAQLRQLQTDAKSLGGAIHYTISADGKNIAGEIERVRQLIQGMNKGDSATVNLKMKGDQAQQVIAALKNDIEDLRKRGGNISVNVNTASVSRASSILQQALAGAGRGAVAGSGIGGNLLIGANFTAGAAASLGAAVAVQGLTHALIEGSKAAIEYNKDMELIRNTFEFFTGSAAKAGAAMAQLRQLAAKSPLSEKETLDVGASFLRINGGDVEQMQKLTELFTVLASARPELGFEKLQHAMQSLISGDFAAFDDVVNNAVGTTRTLAQTGLSGMDLYSKAIERAGGSMALLEKNESSFSTRLSNLQQSLEGINAALGRGGFEALSESIGKANTVLSDHQGTWEKLAEAIGRAVVNGTSFGAIPVPIFLSRLSEDAESLIVLLEKIDRWRNPAKAAEEDAKKPERAVLNDARIQDTGELSKQKQNLVEVQRALRENKSAADEIKRGYEAQLLPLKANLAEIERTNFVLKAQGLLAQQATVKAAQKTEDSLGDPNKRADLAGDKAVLDIQHEILQLQQKRAEKAEEIGKIGQDAAHKIREAEIANAKETLEHLRDEVAARNEARAAALEGLRAEVQARQEARQVALEAIREEMRLRQEARQVALEALREEIRGRQEARQATADALREEIRGRQEARRAAIEALQEEIRARQEARTVALDALKEEIRARRDAYDEQKQLQDNLAQEAERQYQNAERSADAAHRRSQERYREQIDQLRQRDQRLSREDSGPTPAEKELAALEKATKERQRQQSIADAEAAVYNARTGRERREAQHRLEVLKVEQAEERAKEALKEKADAEKEVRDKAAQKRQDDIAALERKAQDEDRKYAKEKEARDEVHRKQQEQLQEQQHIRDEEERRLRHDEDARVRAEEAANKAAEKAEQAEIRAAEKADRDATKQEEAQVRAQERADRAAEQADQAKLRAAEKKAKDEERADQEKLHQQEAADKALDRADAAKVRAQEQADKAQDRADAARIRAEEAAIKAAEKSEADKKRAEEEERDKARILRLQAMKTIEDEMDANRLKTLELINANLTGQAAHDAVLADHLTKVAENLQKLDDIQKALLGNNLKATIEALEIEMGGKLVAIETNRLTLEGELDAVQTKIDSLNTQIDDINRKLAALAAPKGPDGDVSSDGSKTSAAKDGKTYAEKFWDAVQTFFADTNKMVLWIPGALANFIKGWTDQLKANTKMKEANDAFVVAQIIDPWETKLEEHSESKLSARWAGWLVDGFLGPLNTRGPEITTAIEAPFIDFQDNYIPAFISKFDQQVKDINDVLKTNWDAQKVAELLETPFVDFQDKYIPAFQQKLDTQVGESIASIQTKWATAALVTSLEAPFIEFQEQYMPAFIAKLGEQGTAAAEAFLTAWDAFKLDTKITIKVPSGFEEFGKKAGEAFCAGWTTAMAGCPCPDCGGTDTGTGTGGGGENPKQDPRDRSSSTARAVGEALPVQIASVLPSVARATAATTSASNNQTRVPTTVQVNNVIHAVPGMDVETLSEAVTQKTIDRVIDILDYTQSTAPNPVSRTQPGAL